MQPTNVAFVKSGGWEFLICYCCGKKCNKYGWRRCLTSYQKVKDKTAKLVKAGHFSPDKKNTGKDSNYASTATAPPKKMADRRGRRLPSFQKKKKMTT